MVNKSVLPLQAVPWPLLLRLCFLPAHQPAVNCTNLSEEVGALSLYVQGFYWRSDDDMTPHYWTGSDSHLRLVLLALLLLFLLLLLPHLVCNVTADCCAEVFGLQLQVGKGRERRANFLAIKIVTQALCSTWTFCQPFLFLLNAEFGGGAFKIYS